MCISQSTEQHSVTYWLTLAKNGDEAGAVQIWNRYFSRLLELAKRKLPIYARQGADEEDLAISAMNCLLVGARKDRFKKLEDRQDLWQLLVVITQRRACNLKRHNMRRIRAPQRVPNGDDESRSSEILAFVDKQPAASDIAALDDTLQKLMGMLKTEIDRRIVKLKLAGNSRREIADEVGILPDSVNRKLRKIHAIWASHDN